MMDQFDQREGIKEVTNLKVSFLIESLDEARPKENKNTFHSAKYKCDAGSQSYYEDSCLMLVHGATDAS